MYQTGIGAHVSQSKLSTAHLCCWPESYIYFLVSRGNLPEGLLGYTALDHAWEALGMTATSYTPGKMHCSFSSALRLIVCLDILAFAYLAQCRCNPAKTVDYYSCLMDIVETMKNRGIPAPESLEVLLGEERSRNRFTWADVEKAKQLLGFGKDSVLGVDIEDADDEFLIGAWKDGMKRIWREPNGATYRVDLVDAFKIIADLRGSAKLREMWEQNRGSMMTLETAYSTLEVPKDMDETMLLAVFAMRVRAFVKIHVDPGADFEPGPGRGSAIPSG